MAVTLGTKSKLIPLSREAFLSRWPDGVSGFIQDYSYPGTMGAEFVVGACFMPKNERIEVFTHRRLFDVGALANQEGWFFLSLEGDEIVVREVKDPLVKTPEPTGEIIARAELEPEDMPVMGFDGKGRPIRMDERSQAEEQQPGQQD